jgi:hypothetical protein
LISFLLVGYFNRFATDDFEFLNKLREYGIVGSVKWFHEHWNTRWASILLLNGMLLLTLKTGTLVWYHLISISLLFIAFNTILKHVLRSVNEALLLSGYLSIAFFFACFSISDVFFWINTSTMYLYGIIALLFALGEVTSKEHTIPGYLRITGFGLFIGGAYEPLAFTCMITCIVILLLQVRPYNWYVGKIAINKKIIIFLSVLMLGFAFSFAGEGHVVRSSYLPQTDFSFKLWVWVKAVVKIFVVYIPEILLPVLMLSFPFFLLGLIHSPSWVTKELLKKFTIAFVFLTVVSLFPIALIMSEMGPERSWTQVSLYLVLYFAYVSMYAGKFLKKKFKLNHLVSIYAVLISAFVLSMGIKKCSVSYTVLLGIRQPDRFFSRQKKSRQ